MMSVSAGAAPARPPDELSRFCSQLLFEDLPSSLTQKAKRHILDTLGAALAGTQSTEFAALRSIIVPVAAGARIWGTEQRASPRDAALLNGTAAHAFELDDCGGCDHSGAVVVPALLAALSNSPRPVSGRDFIVATIVGYEVGRRLLEASGGYEAHNGAGWHSTGTCGTAAAAAAVARLLGASAEAMGNAITIATSFSSGLWAFIHDGSQTKKLHAGRAAEGGLLAAQLAGVDLRGPSLVFDDVWGGFFRSFNGRHGDPSRFTADLGSVWKLDRVSLKPYASCRGAHSSVDAVADILADTGRSAREIAKVDVELSDMLLGMCGSKDVGRLAGAQMSLPYAVAAFCMFGEGGLSVYGEESRRDPRVAAAMDRIRLLPDAAADPSGEPTIRVIFQDGASFERMVPRATGAPERPMEPAAIDAKFEALAAMALEEDGVHRLKDVLGRLDLLDDAGVLQDALTGTARGRPALR